MISASLQDAGTRLSDLVARAEAGEDVVLEREGRPIVRLVVIAPEPEDGPDRRKVFGCMRGQFSTPTAEAWAEMDREVIQLFEDSARDFPLG